MVTHVFLTRLVASNSVHIKSTWILCYHTQGDAPTMQGFVPLPPHTSCSQTCLGGGAFVMDDMHNEFTLLFLILHCHLSMYATLQHTAVEDGGRLFL